MGGFATRRRLFSYQVWRVESGVNPWPGLRRLCGIRKAGARDGRNTLEIRFNDTLEIVPIPYRLIVNSVEAAASVAMAGAGVARVPF